MSSMGKSVIDRLLSGVGGKFSRELGIDLTGNDPADIFKWFLAAKLFGAGFPRGSPCRPSESSIGVVS
jgi:hypothetical protein